MGIVAGVVVIVIIAAVIVGVKTSQRRRALAARGDAMPCKFQVWRQVGYSKLPLQGGP